jgi:ornithine carbamoyltransferase
MAGLAGRDLLSMADLSTEELLDVVKLAIDLKTQKIRPHCPKILGLLFYKASTRTRLSFTSAMYQIGGQVIDLNPSSMQIGRGEPIEDSARVLDRYLDVLAIRTFSQSDIETYAKYARMPIINALTDWEHPCQVLADLQTIYEKFGKFVGIKLTYCGDGNNMAHSLLIGGALVGMDVTIASPDRFTPAPYIVSKAREIAVMTGSTIELTNDAYAGVSGAQVVYTDVWASMGQEDSAADRLPIFQTYQVNNDLVAAAATDAIVLHCLPAHRGEEITDEVIEGDRSLVWEQAENRLHAQKALLVRLLDVA